MKVILGYDGSEAAKEALKQARSQAIAFDGKVYMVASVVGGSEKHTHEIKQSHADLKYAEKYLKANGVLHESHLLVRGLSPGEDLVQFARENEADMIIIGVKRKSKVGKLVFGSTAQHVILEAHCPVLTVKWGGRVMPSPIKQIAAGDSIILFTRGRIDNFYPNIGEVVVSIF